MKIKIFPYDKNWPILFEKLRSEIKKSINFNDIVIEHIGSTSIKKLASKPIIDILIGIRSKKLDDYIKSITNLGYQYIKEYELETPNRRFFLLEENERRIAHIHLVKYNSIWFKRHIAFRNELRFNNNTRKKYQQLKYSLSKKEWKDSNEYADAKTEFIRDVEKRIIIE
ncbi:MAG: hypothetical protein CMP75_04860 [Flavobacteriales bacterium]|nr:hypothetical protein [Flavobacteriales bacterium]|tara:strand:+ start:2764 stop:3270 length:507 start_codon:yes stop_codon:yes gene_type:complete